MIPNKDSIHTIKHATSQINVEVNLLRTITHRIERPAAVEPVNVTAGNKRFARDDGNVASSSKQFKSDVQPTLMYFVNKKESREEILAKLAAADGFPINAICKSEFIGKALIKVCYFQKIQRM